jgi:hypothetical protein
MPRLQRTRTERPASKSEHVLALAEEAAVTVTEAVNADELIALFTGVEHPEDGGWETTPTYTVPLAYAIARELAPSSDTQLRKAMYGERPADEIDAKAVYVIELAFQRYRVSRDVQTMGRGL